MPTLTRFTLQHCRPYLPDDEATGDSLIEMPHLEQLIVHAESPRYFALLNQRLATPQSTKRRLELRTLELGGWDRWQRWFTTMPPCHQWSKPQVGRNTFTFAALPRRVPPYMDRGRGDIIRRCLVGLRDMLVRKPDVFGGHASQ